MRFAILSLLLMPLAYAGNAVIGSGISVNYDASTQSAALTAPANGIQKYRIASTTSIHYVIGADPVAESTTGVFLPANVVDYVLIPTGHKIAAVKAAGANAGLLSIHKVAK